MTTKVPNHPVTSPSRSLMPWTDEDRRWVRRVAQGVSLGVLYVVIAQALVVITVLVMLWFGVALCSAATVAVG